MNSDKISISTIPVNTHNDLPYTDLLDSFYCIKEIKKDIYEKTTRVIVYNLTLKNMKITIYLNDVTNEQNITKHIMLHVFSMIDLLLEYTTGNNSKKTLTIYLYLSDNEKILPNMNVMPLGVENVNTAVTYEVAANMVKFLFLEKKNG